MLPKRSLFYLLLIMLILILVLTIKGCSTKTRNTSDIEFSKVLTQEAKLKVYNASQKKDVEMYLEDYVKGVVAAEMPADYGIEALKAQAVAARTYVYGRVKHIYGQGGSTHPEDDICTDPAHCQAWISKEDALRRWGGVAASSNWTKIDEAVNETKGQIITYNGEVINPLFHSNSGGTTENVEDVWSGGAVPYLKSVFSLGEDKSPEYKDTVTITFKDFVKKIKKAYPSAKISEKNLMKSIKITGMTAGGRVKTVKVGAAAIGGTDFRSLFSLKSANFSIKQSGKNSLAIETLGYGHGVGMSQCGANYLAELGESYVDILKYYYTGVEVSGK